MIPGMEGERYKGFAIAFFLYVAKRWFDVYPPRSFET